MNSGDSRSANAFQSSSPSTDTEVKDSPSDKECVLDEQRISEDGHVCEIEVASRAGGSEIGGNKIDEDGQGCDVDVASRTGGNGSVEHFVWLELDSWDVAWQQPAGNMLHHKAVCVGTLALQVLCAAAVLLCVRFY